jgi:SAM-dependent methyltransferase
MSMATTTLERLLIQLFVLSPPRGGLEIEEAARAQLALFGVEADAAALRIAANELIDRGIALECDGTVRLTRDGAPVAHRAMLEFDFTEGQAMSVRSSAERAYRDRLRAHGLVGLTDPPQREFLVKALAGGSPPIVDVGCGDGEISAEIASHTGLRLVGVDVSEDAIAHASRTYPSVSFSVGDMQKPDALPPTIGSVLAVDSLYFVSDPSEVLAVLLGRMGRDGIGVVLHSLYAGPGEETVDVRPERAPFWKLVSTAPYRCEVTDFSEREPAIWETKRREIESMQDDYYRERAGYLYWSCKRETSILARLTAAGRSARYGFVVRRA